MPRDLSRFVKGVKPVGTDIVSGAEITGISSKPSNFAPRTSSGLQPSSMVGFSFHFCLHRVADLTLESKEEAKKA